MPLISDVTQKKPAKIFKKTNYRPWDIEEEKISPELKHQNNDLPNEENLVKVCRGLYGAQRLIILFLMKNIEEENNDFFITKNISILYFIEHCNIPANTIKKSCQLLKKKDLIDTYDKKPGRGGYVRYRIFKSTFKYLESNILEK